MLKGSVVAGLMVMLAGGSALAQDFPTKPIRFLVPYAAGGNTDVIARITAQRMGELLGQPVIVENRPGAGTMLATRAMLQAPADGYTLLVSVPTMAIAAAVSKSADYKMTDVVPVSGICSNAFVISVARTVPATTLSELVAYAKANPGKLNNGSVGIGSGSQLITERFKTAAGIKSVEVVYQGAAPVLKDLTAGTVDFFFDGVPTSVALHRDNRIRVMAITTENRHPSAPEIPTFREQGFPMMTASNWTALFASAKTPDAIVQRLSREAYRAVSDQAVKERFVKMGLDPMEMNPAAFTTYVAKDIAIWQDDAKRTGVQLD